MGREIEACNVCVITQLTPIAWLYWDTCRCSDGIAAVTLHQRLIPFWVRHLSTCTFLIPAVIAIFFSFLIQFFFFCAYSTVICSPRKAAGGFSGCGGVEGYANGGWLTSFVIVISSWLRWRLCDIHSSVCQYCVRQNGEVKSLFHVPCRLGAPSGKHATAKAAVLSI